MEFRLWLGSSSEMAPFRKIAFKILGGTTMISILVMWLSLPLYWGSRGSYFRIGR